MTKPFWMARLAGTQAEMGAHHGRLVAREAAALFAFYKTMPERTLAGDMTGAVGAIGKVAVRALVTAWQHRLVRDRPAELAERTRAFAEAVKALVPDASVRDSLLAFATMDSLQNCVSLAARGKVGPFAGTLPRAIVGAVPACTSGIAWGHATHDGELMFGRNFDFPGVGVWDAAPAFTVCAPTGGMPYGFFATRGADTPVVTVVNEAGLILAPHTRWHRDTTFGGAMIVDVVHEIARRAETLDEAIRIAKERPISSSWGIAVGSARERSGIVIEIAGPRVEVVRPTPGASFLPCSTRYRTPALQVREIAATEAWSIHSDRRERRLRTLIEQRRAPLTPEMLAGFLGDRLDGGMMRHLGAVLAQPTNVHCAVVTPGVRRAIVGIDHAPVCEGRWAELAWEWTGATGGWELGATAPGFTARVRDDIGAPHDAATTAIYEASQAYDNAHDVASTLGALERAVTAAPDDPSLRMPAAWLALEHGQPVRALVHVEAGLETEADPYRRGQLLLWGSRIAKRVGDASRATRWFDELERLGIAELTTAAQRSFRGKPRVNLMMADAY
ncbi:hypothetical protein BH11MYX1_BH11MYX1_30380 [soil metagenome]